MIDNDAIFNAGLEEQSAEKLFKDEEDFIVGDIESWETGKDKILFITGLSGSGKTTYSMKIGKAFPDMLWISLDYTMTMFKLDRLKGKEYFIKMNEQIVWDFFHKTPEGINAWNADNPGTGWINSLIDYVIANTKKRSIIEGIQLIGYCFNGDTIDTTKLNKLTSHPMIIIGSSVRTSTKRANDRDIERIKNGFINLKHKNFIGRMEWLFKNLKLNLRLEHKKNKILKQIQTVQK